MSTIATTVDQCAPVGRKEISIPQSLINKIVITSTLGITVEWYDFFVFGYLAAVVGIKFFPAGDVVAQTIAGLSAFAVGSIFRPLGALIFGILGDKIGRKPCFMVSVLMMGAATVGIGLLPTYDDIGLTATICIFLFRVCQGISVGGAWGGAVTYVVESVPQHKRGFYGSFIPLSGPLACAVASGVMVTLNTVLSKAQMDAWGWRVPFLLSIVMVFLAIYLRSKLLETPVFNEMKKDGGLAKAPFRETLKHWKKLIMVCIVTIGMSVGWFSSYFGMPSTMKVVGKMPAADVANIMAIAALLSCVGYVAVGHLCDRWGRRPMLLIGFGLAAFTWYPLTLLLKTGSFYLMAMVPIVLTMYTAFYFGPYGAWITEIFPARIRYTALSVGYHFPVGVFGGVAPLIVTYLSSQSNDPIAGAWIPIALTGLAFVVSAFFLKETKEECIFK